MYFHLRYYKRNYTVFTINIQGQFGKQKKFDLPCQEFRPTLPETYQARSTAPSPKRPFSVPNTSNMKDYLILGGLARGLVYPLAIWVVQVSPEKKSCSYKSVR